MNSLLSPTGTAALLSELSPHIPDAFINELFSPTVGRGRRARLRPAQLWRLHLLGLLTPVHSFNLLVQMLPEQKAWRQFAHLANRQAVPDVWMLNDFRQRVGVMGLRRINEHLLEPLLPRTLSGRLSVALIDATDFEAACSGHKKRGPANTRPSGRPWAHGRSKPGRAAFLSATRNTAYACGCGSMNAVSCWCHWSVG